MTILEHIKARLNENDEWRGFAKYYPNHEIIMECWGTLKFRVKLSNDGDYVTWLFFAEGNKRFVTNCSIMTHFQVDVQSIANMIQPIYLELTQDLFADLRAENDQH